HRSRQNFKVFFRIKKKRWHHSKLRNLNQLARPRKSLQKAPSPNRAHRSLGSLGRRYPGRSQEGRNEI
ncbi:hypothetical protein MIMGU_mgv1a021769mg, partial [Erythranthe guttata]